MTEEGAGGKHEQVIKSVAAASFYAFMSGAMAFINKSLVTNYGFNCPMFILLIQMLMLVCAFEACSTLRLITLSAYTAQLGKSLLYPSLLYIASSSFALLSLSDLNIPMYNVIKRLCPLVNVLLARFMLHNYGISPRVLSTVLLITVGSVLAGYGDLTFNMEAYLYGLASTIFQSLYLLMVQKCAKEDAISVLDISFIISVNALPMCLISIFIFGELPKLTSFHGWHLQGFAANFFLVTFSGTLLVYSQFLCTSVTSALTTSVSSSIKSVLTTIIGLFTFGGIHVTPMGAFGIALNTVGGVLYTLFKCLESKRPLTVPTSIRS